MYQDPVIPMSPRTAEKRKESETEALIHGLISNEDRLPGTAIQGTLVAIAIKRQNDEVTLVDSFPEVTDMQKPYSVYGFIKDRYNNIDYRFPLSFLTAY
jgi:hypothetical protein